MSLRRFNPRRDASELPIIVAMRRAGASVQQLSGKDIPDLLVGWQGQNLLMEVKTPRKAPSRPSTRRKTNSAPDARTEGQLGWADRWRGDRPHVVTTPQEALAILLTPPTSGRMLPEIEP